MGGNCLVREKFRSVKQYSLGSRKSPKQAYALHGSTECVVYRMLTVGVRRETRPRSSVEISTIAEVLTGNA
jgi:hypothetical protein